MKKNFIIFIAILVLIPTFVASLLFSESKVSYASNTEITGVINNTEKKETNKKEKEITIKVNKNNEVLELNLEDYIVGVVAGEMPASFNSEALKAQAVASRTYAMYKMQESDNYEMKSTTDDQVYNTIEEMKSKWGSDFDKYYNKIKSAVNDTKGLVMKQDNKIFKSFYFAMSNGYTEDSSAVFGESNLVSVSSPWDNESLNKFIVETIFSKEEVARLLNINSIDNIEIISRDKTNRVSTIKVNNKKYTGVEFRMALKLRSTDFTIKEDNGNYIITTKGYGHGVGMSQYGANGMANDNYTYDKILKYYYYNVEITEI